MMVVLEAFAASLILAVTLTAVIRAVAPRLGLVDAPRSDRWHRRPVSRFGGLAIYLAFTIPAAFWWQPEESHQLLGLLVGGAAIFLVGLIDDLVRLENRPKLVLLIACATIPVAFGVRFAALPPVAGTALAIIWILGATNAFNWLDNMDGVAAGTAVIAAGSLIGLAFLSGDGALVPLAAALAGAALGFLLHNFPPARIFMGDSGSGFLGFTLATLALMGSYREVSNVLLVILIPGLILAVPIFDTAVVAFSRVFHGRSIFQGGRDHPGHRLAAMGLSERRAVLLLYALSAVTSLVALGTSRLALIPAVSVSVIVALLFVAFGLVLSEIQVYEDTPVPPRATPLPRPFLNKKWILVMLLDIILVSIAYTAAHLLRYEGELPEWVAATVETTLPLVIVSKMLGLYVTGVYRGAWRYAGIPDFIRIIEGITAGALLGGAGLFLWTRLENISRTALVMDWMVALLLVAGSRLSLRLLREYLESYTSTGRRALIFGAGRGGVLLLRELRQNRALGYVPVGFIDDDPGKRGAIIQGLTVLGSRRDLAEQIRKNRVEEVLLAAPSCPPDVLADVVGTSEAAGAKFKRLGRILE